MGHKETLPRVMEYALPLPERLSSFPFGIQEGTESSSCRKTFYTTPMATK